MKNQSQHFNFLHQELLLVTKHEQLWGGFYGDVVLSVSTPRRAAVSGGGAKLCVWVPFEVAPSDCSCWWNTSHVSEWQHHLLLLTTRAHTSFWLTAPTKPQCILGTIRVTGDHGSGQRTQTQRRGGGGGGGWEMDDGDGRLKLQETLISNLHCRRTHTHTHRIKCKDLVCLHSNYRLSKALCWSSFNQH